LIVAEDEFKAGGSQHATIGVDSSKRQFDACFTGSCTSGHAHCSGLISPTLDRFSPDCAGRAQAG